MKVFHHVSQVGIAALLLSLSNQAHAKMKNSKEDEPVAYLGDKTPPYTNPVRFLMQASFIYWQADVDGIDFSFQQNLSNEIATSTTGTTTTTQISVVDQMKNRNLNFQWDPGFRIGFGTVFGDRDEWDFLLNWTWLQSKAHRSISTGEVPTFPDIEDLTLGASYQIPGFSSVFSGSPATNSKTHWYLHYNTLDLEFGRNFFLAKKLALRPHIGLRGAWIHQNTKANYIIASNGSGFFPFGALFPDDGSGDQVGSSQFKGKNDYNALGLRGGMDMRLNFLQHFCVYGSLSGAILYGEFKVDETFAANVTSSSVVGSGTNVVSYDSQAFLKDSYHRTRTNLQAVLGVMWHTSFNNDKQHLSIGASYEANQWYQQNELQNIQGTLPFTLNTSSTNGDLGLHGITFDVRFDL